MGHVCSVFSDGRELLNNLRYENYDLLVLDWYVPGVRGMEILFWLRRRREDTVPVMFVTNAAFDYDVVQALNAGADDYIVKPVSRQVLAARIQNLLRRLYRSDPDEALEVGVYRFEADRQTVRVRERQVRLTSKEYDLARRLFSRKGQILTRDYLFGAIWGDAYVAESRTLDTHISHIRTKLGLNQSNGVRLMPVYGVGYRLDLT